MTKVIDFPKLQAVQAVIFVRVSSKDQERGYSLEAQKHRLHTYCVRRGLSVLREFEITESSTKGDRKKFMEMINFCKTQRKPTAIVVDKIDRLQRSFKEYPLLDSLVGEGKIELHFNTEGYVIHRDSVSTERLMWSFGVITAQSYVDNLRDNVRRAIEHKVRSGEYSTRSPLGYLNVRVDGRADIVIDPLRANLIQKLFIEYSTGLYTLKHLVKLVKEWGLTTREGNPVSRPQINRILNNPFYYGVMDMKGKMLPHRYPPLIDKMLFERCKEVTARHNKVPFAYRGKDFIFRGILTCKENGRTVSAVTRKKTYVSGRQAQWTYLYSWDKSKKLYVREERILLQALDALRKLVIPSKILEDVIKCLRSFGHEQRDFHTRVTEELKKEDGAIQARLFGLQDLLIDKAITREEYDQRRAKLQERQIEITHELEVHREGDTKFTDAMLFLIDVCNNAHETFKGSTIEQKRLLLNFVFCNLSLDGANLCYSYRTPFAEYVKMQKDGNWREIIYSLATNSEFRLEIINLMQVHRAKIEPLLKSK